MSDDRHPVQGPAVDGAAVDGSTRQVPMPEIGDGSGAVAGQATVRATAVPFDVERARATVPTVPQVPTATGSGVAGLGEVRQGVVAGDDPWLDELDEIDFGDVEEATDPDAEPPPFCASEPAAPASPHSASPTAPAAPATAPTSPAASASVSSAPSPAAASPAAASPASANVEAAPSQQKPRRNRRRRKSQRRAKKQDRAAEKARARATTRAAGTGPLAEELPADAIEPTPFFNEPPALPGAAPFELQMPTKRRRSRQDMQNMLQEFSVMFRMDTKVRKRRSGWLIAAGVIAVGAALSFLLTRSAPVDPNDDEAIRAVLVEAAISHADATVYLLDTSTPLPAEVTDAAPPKRAKVSLLALKLAQLSHLRALKRAGHVK